ncbi:MAG TPA: NlpC/P60 family protein [Gaiellaceae bacterium]|nr:NlpC/P60 family protein [Gaiellaceae bacterium]
MRKTLCVLAGLALWAPAALPAASAAPPPALTAKQAQARAVLAKVNALDVRFGKVVDSWNGAKIQLAASERALAANEAVLGRARKRSLVADGRLAQRLVAIYKGEEPTLVQVLAGAATLSNLIDRLEAVKTISAYDRRVADDALRAKTALASARVRLRATEQKRRATVAQLAGQRRQIGTMLTRRRHLLSSIQSEIAAMKKREAARQARLAAEARARLAREQAALLARQAAERAAAAQAAAQRASAPATTAVTTTAPQPAVTTAATTTEPAATTAVPSAATTTAAASVAPPVLGPGHPEAASVALRYLGIPYRWGGDSPATGFDCSGFVMYVYAQLGILLPHQSAAQYGYGTPVPRAQLQPGDLVFFDGLSHVGIYIGNGQFVHAPETGDVVKISPLTEFPGSRYVGARRL